MAKQPIHLALNFLFQRIPIFIHSIWVFAEPLFVERVIVELGGGGFHFFALTDIDIGLQEGHSLDGAGGGEVKAGGFVEQRQAGAGHQPFEAMQFLLLFF